MQYRVEIVISQEDGDDSADVVVTCHDVGDSLEDREKIAYVVETFVPDLIRNGAIVSLTRRN